LIKDQKKLIADEERETDGEWKARKEDCGGSVGGLAVRFWELLVKTQPSFEAQSTKDIDLDVGMLRLVRSVVEQPKLSAMQRSVSIGELR
jgi:hypothetical protein